MQSISDFLSSFFRPLTNLGRPIKLAEPFIGIGGASEMLRAAGIPVISFNVFDMEEKLEAYHSSKSANTEHHLVNARFGKNDGNFCNVPKESLVDVDGWISGPPCQPWAGNGFRKGRLDPRAQCFVRSVEAIEYLGSERQSLTFFALENSPNIDKKCKDGSQLTFADEMVFRLKLALPNFIIDTVIVSLCPALPHDRTRWWLRGMRRDLCIRPWSCKLPPVLDLPVRVKLIDLLDPNLRNIPASSMTAKRAANVVQYMELLRAKKPELDPTVELAVFDIDRAIGKKWPAQIRYDVVPALRTKGPEYFIVSIRDVEEPLPKRKFFRLLTDSERFALQGHPVEHARFCKSRVVTRMVTGNAFAVPMVAAVVGPLMLLAFDPKPIMNSPAPKRQRTS